MKVFAYFWLVISVITVLNTFIDLTIDKDPYPRRKYATISRDVFALVFYMGIGIWTIFLLFIYEI